MITPEAVLAGLAIVMGVLVLVAVFVGAPPEFLVVGMAAVVFLVFAGWLL